MPIQKIARFISGMLLVLTSWSALSQEFPSKPLRIIVPLVPGGGPTASATLFGEQMGSLLKQPIVVDHRPGASGVVAINELMRSPADGYSMIFLDAGHWAIAPSMQKDLPYEPLRDLAPIGSVYKAVQVIVVRSDFPAKDLKELIALARAKPGALQYGVNGGGSTQQLIFEYFKAALKLQIQTIPYKGSAQALQSVLGGDVPIACIGWNTAQPHVQAGKLRALAVSMGKRGKQVPEIPTVAELTGLTDFDFAGELGIFVRNGTPKPVVDKLVATFRTAAANPDLIAKSFKGGQTIEPSTPEELTQTVRADLVRYGLAVKAAGLAPS